MAPIQDRIFRSAALQRHTSPDGLDATLEITTVRGWVALAAFGAVLLAALIWGVIGRIPEAVLGQGIMVSAGGVYRVQTSGAGRIDSVLVSPGTRVRRGQTIALLAQPELRTALAQRSAALAALRQNYEATAALLSSDRRLELAALEQQQAQADEELRAAQERLAYLDARVAAEAQALARGLITRDAAQGTIAQRAETNLQQLSTLARKQQLGARAVQLRVASSQRVFELEREIAQSANDSVRLEAQLVAFANVVSAYDGIVVEQLADAGQTVGAGAPIVTVEPSGERPQVLMFIPLEGRRIEPGMRTEMVPGGVRPEETGYFLGRVERVSDAPLSGSALDRYLKNEVLVEQFTQSGGAYLVHVSVEADSGTVSGYRWTSRAGAPISFGSGTLVTGRIIVREVRPVALIIPALKRWLGAGG
jgi:HlyD family secretion protein